MTVAISALFICSAWAQASIGNAAGKALGGEEGVTFVLDGKRFSYSNNIQIVVYLPGESVSFRTPSQSQVMEGQAGIAIAARVGTESHCGPKIIEFNTPGWPQRRDFDQDGDRDGPILYAGLGADGATCTIATEVRSSATGKQIIGHFTATLANRSGSETYSLTDGFFRIALPDHAVGGGTGKSQ